MVFYKIFFNLSRNIEMKPRLLDINIDLTSPISQYLNDANFDLSTTLLIAAQQLLQYLPNSGTHIFLEIFSTLR